MKLALLLSSAAALANASPTIRRATTPTVTVKNGTVDGMHSTTYNQDLFLGIPYAQPPTDELRFRNPQSINSSFSSTLQATEYAPECVGYGVCRQFQFVFA